MNFDLDLVLQGQYADWMLQGFRLSVVLTLAALSFALPLGIVVALLRTAPQRALRAAAWLFVESIRNVPLLAHLLFWYFAFPELLPETWKEALYASHTEAICAVIALSLYGAAYMSEDIRSGLRAVPAGQMQAARALGLGRLQALRYIVLPQALRLTVPPLISQTLNLWKDTSVATVIGVGELMYHAAKVETASFRSLEVFTVASAAYLSVSLLIGLAAAAFQRRYPARAGRA